MEKIVFGKRLKKLRRAKGWSQERLAEELHVSRQAVYKWESNKGYPDIANLILISDLFEITVDELIKEHPNVKSSNHEKTMNTNEEDEGFFEDLSDPGSILGMILALIGFFVDSGTISTLLIGTGLVFMVFSQSIFRSVAALVKNFKQELKNE